MTFRELLAIEPKIALNRGVGCRYEVEDVVELRRFLSDRIGSSATALATDIAKLGCKYDQLVFGDDFTGDRQLLHASLGIPSLT